MSSFPFWGNFHFPFGKLWEMSSFPQSFPDKKCGEISSFFQWCLEENCNYDRIVKYDIVTFRHRLFSDGVGELFSQEMFLLYVKFDQFFYVPRKEKFFGLCFKKQNLNGKEFMDLLLNVEKTIALKMVARDFLPRCTVLQS